MSEWMGAVDDHVAGMRQRNEHWIAGFLAVVSGAFVLSSLLQVLGPDADLGAYSTFVVAALYGLYYAGVWWRTRTTGPGSAEVAVRTVLEVSVPTLLTLLDAQVSAEFALPRSSVVLYAIGILLTVLRLRPWLAPLAGGLVVVEWMSLWALLSPQVTNPLVVQAALPAAVNRSLLLGFCAFLAWRIAKSHLELTSSVVSTAIERERVRRAFGVYVAEPVVERILAGDLTAGTERRPISVLFVDIRSFTRFAEGKTPSEVLDRLNRVLEAFSAEVQANGGIVNKYLGDGLMAIFGAPEIDEAHAAAATRAARGIARAALRLDNDGVYPDLRIGVGVHCGEVVVGDIGGDGQREYTAIGDVVNVASRVESATKELGVTVLVTDAVRQAVGEDFSLRDRNHLSLRGRNDRVRVWEVDI